MKDCVGGRKKEGVYECAWKTESPLSNISDENGMLEEWAGLGRMRPETMLHGPPPPIPDGMESLSKALHQMGLDTPVSDSIRTRLKSNDGNGMVLSK